MKVALIQTDLIWENPAANLNQIDKIIQRIDLDTDLVVLPEMFTTGFSMNPSRLAESMDGETIQWLKNTAYQQQKAIIGSVIINHNNQYFNRLIIALPDNQIYFYDKRHLFTLVGEQNKYTAGKHLPIITFKNWRICMLICYDLRFPVYSRNTNKYDLLVYIANWPESRIQAWDILLRARAVENMVYTIGVNRIGTDANNNIYCGHSQAIDFLGNYLINPQISSGVFYTYLNKENQETTRNKFGFLNDADSFEIH